MTSFPQSNDTETVTVPMIIGIKDETMEYKILSLLERTWEYGQDQTSEMYDLMCFGDGDD